MDTYITSYENYSIWQLSNENLWELAKFVVDENYKHHAGGIVPSNYLSEIEAIFIEEQIYFNFSKVFVAKNSEQKVIGAIRIMNYTGNQTLPLQKLFNITSLTHISPQDSDIAMWHIGRFAVATDLGRFGILLFKQLLLYALQPICNAEKGIVFAECDSKLLRTMRTMGIQVLHLANGIEYLGSETIPAYATRDGIESFFNRNKSLLNHLNASA